MLQSVKFQLYHFTSTARIMVWAFRNSNFGTFCRLVFEHVKAWVLASVKTGKYYLISDDQLAKRKRSDTVFVFGSGYSINDITDVEWKKIAEHDSIGFNCTYNLEKIPITYYVLRAGMETIEGALEWGGDLKEIISAVDKNPYLDETVFFFQKGFTSLFCNRALGFDRWNKNRPLRLFFSDKVSRYPTLTSTAFLAHRAGTLCTAVSLAVGLKYKRIVLVGVDLYDCRYFWMPSDMTMGWSEEEKKSAPMPSTVHGWTPSQLHNTVRNGIVEIMGLWRTYLNRHGVELLVYNPRSLLAEKLPIFSWQSRDRTGLVTETQVV